MTNPRLTHLKIKRKTLAAEAGFIRAEERKLKARTLYHRKKAKDGGLSAVAHTEKARQLLWQRLDLVDHRKGIVRDAARTNHLAHACLTGMPYSRVESKVGSDNLPNWERVKAVALRFGGDSEAVEAWVTEAGQYIKHCAWKEAA